MSLDGYIADGSGATNWLVGDPDLDPKEFFATIDTIVMGRRTYDVMLAAGLRTYPGFRTYVVSRTLTQQEFPEVTIISADVVASVAALRAESGDRDIWLAGGGTLASALLAEQVVDTIEVGISPRVLAQAGRPLFVPRADTPSLKPFALELTRSRFMSTGLVVLEYDVHRRD